MRFNSDSESHELDPVIAQALVPQLLEDGRAVIPAGFGLFAQVDIRPYNWSFNNPEA